jgi:succinate dehydrogenase / fumarate reductase flavoprotein subunit
MSNIPGLLVAGEANFSDHGANRLGASALMQGLADGYFVLPYTVGNYLAQGGFKKVTTDDPAFGEAEASVTSNVKKMLAINGKRSVHDFRRALGKIMWDKVGMARNRTGRQDVRVPGDGADFNKQLEDAGRVADFLELGELMALDALNREESCGGHFREEHQTEEGEAKRNDDKFAYVAAWEYTGANQEPVMHQEPLTFDNVHLTQRSYK